VSVPARLTGRGRLRRQFDERKDAEAWAVEQWAGTRGLGEAFFDLSATERREAVAALDLLRPLGVRLQDVATQYAQVYPKLGGRPLAEAVDFFVQRNPLGMPVKTVDEVYREMLAAKRADSASSVYLKDLTVRIRCF